EAKETNRPLALIAARVPPVLAWAPELETSARPTTSAASCPGPVPRLAHSTTSPARCLAMAHLWPFPMANGPLSPGSRPPREPHAHGGRPGGEPSEAGGPLSRRRDDDVPGRAAQEVLDVLHGAAQPAVDHLASLAAVVRRQDDVRQREDGVAGRDRLLVEDVERGAGDPPLAERFDQCRLVHQRA